MGYRESAARRWGAKCGIYKRKRDENGYRLAICGYEDWLDTLTSTEGCEAWFADEYVHQFEELWKIA